MRRVNIFLLCLLAACRLYSQDFRNLSWGMSMSEVEALEGKPISKEDSEFHYTRKLIGLDWEMILQFKEDKLSAAMYLYETKGALLSLCFEEMNAMLIEKYGKPLVYFENQISNWDNNKGTGITLAIHNGERVAVVYMPKPDQLKQKIEDLDNL